MGSHDENDAVIENFAVRAGPYDISVLDGHLQEATFHVASARVEAVELLGSVKRALWAHPELRYTHAFDMGPEAEVSFRRRTGAIIAVHSRHLTAMLPELDETVDAALVNGARPSRGFLNLVVTVLLLAPQRTCTRHWGATTSSSSQGCLLRLTAFVVASLRPASCTTG